MSSSPVGRHRAARTRPIVGRSPVSRPSAAVSKVGVIALVCGGSIASVTPSAMASVSDATQRAHSAAFSVLPAAIVAPTVADARPVGVLDMAVRTTAGTPSATVKIALVDPLAPVQTDASRASRGGHRLTIVNGGGLAAVSRAALEVVRANFPQIRTIGGYRPGDRRDHGTGHALDVMIPSWSSGSGVALGNSLAAFMQAHADVLHVKYVIWRQRIWFPGSSASDWHGMASRGGATANHMDHVHISFN